MSAVAHFFVVVSGSKIHERAAHFFIDIYSETHRIDDEQVKNAFNKLYELMNGMSLREMDYILDPVCSLCRAHERSGFIEGIKVGLQLGQEQHIS